MEGEKRLGQEVEKGFPLQAALECGGHEAGAAERNRALR